MCAVNCQLRARPRSVGKPGKPGHRNEGGQTSGRETQVTDKSRAKPIQASRSKATVRPSIRPRSDGGEGNSARASGRAQLAAAHSRE